MAGEKIQRFLSIQLTQGGADTFVQGSVSTDIIPENGLVYQVSEVILSFQSVFSTLAADAWVQWSLSRDTKTAAYGMQDADIMLFDGFSFSLTTSGAAVIKQQYRYENLRGLYIVEPTIYAQLGSATTGITNVATMRIYYDEVKMSEVEILRILNNS